MLKKLSKLFLGLIVCAGSACVTPTHASSASPVILTHIQASGATGAKEEMVALYNTSASPIDISGWCLTNKVVVTFYCYNPPEKSLAYYLPGYSYGVVVSEQYSVPSVAESSQLPAQYTVTNQVSGSIVSTKDTISLIDSQGSTIDSYEWSAPISTGKMLQRLKLTNTKNNYDLFDFRPSWVQVEVTLPLNQVQLLEREIDPIDETKPEANVNLYVSEMFPNPNGTDIGNEFIEIGNPSETDSISLDAYSIKVGQKLEKTYQFPKGIILKPLELKAFFNSDIKFTLLNSSSGVQLLKNGEELDEHIEYTDVPEGYSYSLIDESSFSITQPTPNANNAAPFKDFDKEGVEELGATVIPSSPKPCADDQYRHSETNRCRKKVTVASLAQTPCAANQYRSLETNRCRNKVAKVVQSACKEGQSRNPETNRCRTIAKMTSADHGAKQVEVEESAVGVRWYWLLGVAGVVGVIVAYGVWEWRVELATLLKNIRTRLARLKN